MFYGISMMQELLRRLKLSRENLILSGMRYGVWNHDSNNLELTFVMFYVVIKVRKMWIKNCLE